MQKKQKLKIKRRDDVVVISGAQKGKRGKVLEILSEKMRIIIEGVALRKCHKKASRENPEGSISEREGSIHYSNVMLAKTFDEKKK